MVETRLKDIKNFANGATPFSGPVFARSLS